MLFTLKAEQRRHLVLRQEVSSLSPANSGHNEQTNSRKKHQAQRVHHVRNWHALHGIAQTHKGIAWATEHSRPARRQQRKE